MDNNNERKKESIDDILSDLNGLLNKMPSILDGIKMPEIKPVEFRKTEQAPVVTPPAGGDLPPSRNAAPFDADKTVVLADFSGLAEGASAPGEQLPAQSSSYVAPSPAAELSRPGADSPGPEEKASFDADKTVVINSLSSLPEGASAPAEGPEKLVLQSLGDFMFGGSDENAGSGVTPPAGSPAKLEGSPLEPPAARVKTDAPKAASLSISELKPLNKDAGTPEAGLEEASLKNPDREEELSFNLPEEGNAAGPGQPENASGLPVAGLNQSNDSSADFSIPDIDALLQMSEGKPAEGQDAAPAPLTPAKAPEPSADDLVEFEKQLAAVAPQEANMDADKFPEGNPEPAPLPENTEPGAQQSFGAFTIEPSSPEAVSDVPAPEAAAPLASGLELPAYNADENLAASPAPEQAAAQAESGGIEPGIPAPEAPAASPAEAETVNLAPADGASAGGIELAGFPAAENQAAENTSQFSPDTAAALQPPAQEPEPVFTVGRPADGPLSGPIAESDGDKTMVVSAPGGGDDEKTVIFQAGAAPGITNRAKISDLADLSKKSVPDGVPAERVRSLYFLYSPVDGAMCANLLAELDAVCLRSQATPMFIKRAGVKVFDLDMNANFVLQTATDSGAAGLVCVGGIPQEKVYEIENVFTSSGVYFKHFDPDSFTHSAVLDTLLEMILR